MKAIRCYQYTVCRRVRRISAADFVQEPVRCDIETGRREGREKLTVNTIFFLFLPFHLIHLLSLVSTSYQHCHCVTLNTITATVSTQLISYMCVFRIQFYHLYDIVKVTTKPECHISVLMTAENNDYESIFVKQASRKSKKCCFVLTSTIHEKYSPLSGGIEIQSRSGNNRKRNKKSSLKLKIGFSFICQYFNR